MKAENKWIDWAQKINAIAQNGLAFGHNQYEKERCYKLKEIASEILSNHSNLSEDEIKVMLSNEAGYTTPKIDTRAAIFRGDKVLLIREVEDGGWTMPGGFADVGDSPREAIEREVFEESGYTAKATKLIALFDRNKHPHTPYMFHLYKAFFLCEITGGEPRTSFETDGVDFFPVYELPNLSVGRTTSWQIQRCYEHYKNPELPTEFD